jgi:hypothetical protein
MTDLISRYDISTLECNQWNTIMRTKVYKYGNGMPSIMGYRRCAHDRFRDTIPYPD